MRKLGLVFVLGFVVVFLSACEESPGFAPRPESDSPQTYESDSRVPIDFGVYTITGVVAGDVESLTRQTEAARGSIGGAMTSGLGFISGSFFGPEISGKGFIRLSVEESDSQLAPTGGVTLLKVTDTKAILLAPGDRVTFKCRAQFEAVAPVAEFEKFDPKKVETWELDYCRLVSPTIKQPEAKA